VFFARSYSGREKQMLFSSFSSPRSDAIFQARVAGGFMDQKESVKAADALPLCRFPTATAQIRIVATGLSEWASCMR